MAFIVSVVGIFGLFILGADFVLFGLPDWLVPVFNFLGLGGHFDSVSRGVIDSRDLVYYFSVIGFFLYLNVKSIETRR